MYSKSFQSHFWPSIYHVGMKRSLSIVRYIILNIILNLGESLIDACHLETLYGFL